MHHLKQDILGPSFATTSDHHSEFPLEPQSSSTLGIAHDIQTSSNTYTTPNLQDQIVPSDISPLSPAFPESFTTPKLSAEIEVAADFPSLNNPVQSTPNLEYFIDLSNATFQSPTNSSIDLSSF